MTGKTDKINDITKLKYNKDAASAIGHIFRLAGENEKLRAALREIKRRTQDAHSMSYVADYWRIANEALGEKECKETES